MTYDEELFKAKCYGFVAGVLSTVIFQVILVGMLK